MTDFVSNPSDGGSIVRPAPSEGQSPRLLRLFIAELIRRGLDDERRWDDIEAALGAIPDEGHEWDDDPGEWVRRQRADQRRVG